MKSCSLDHGILENQGRVGPSSSFLLIDQIPLGWWSLTADRKLSYMSSDKVFLTDIVFVNQYIINRMDIFMSRRSNLNLWMCIWSGASGMLNTEECRPNQAVEGSLSVTEQPFFDLQERLTGKTQLDVLLLTVTWRLVWSSLWIESYEESSLHRWPYLAKWAIRMFTRPNRLPEHARWSEFEQFSSKIVWLRALQPSYISSHENLGVQLVLRYN